jgi:hypothetical protein
MNSAQIEQTLQRLNASDLNAQAIPVGHPLISQLERLFGEHTYFLDLHGLAIVEPVEAENGHGRMGVVINLASWVDANGEGLQPHEPEPTELMVDLATDSHH